MSYSLTCHTISCIIPPLKRISIWFCYFCSIFVKIMVNFICFSFSIPLSVLKIESSIVVFVAGVVIIDNSSSGFNSNFKSSYKFFKLSSAFSFNSLFVKKSRFLYLEIVFSIIFSKF